MYGIDQANERINFL